METIIVILIITVGFLLGRFAIKAGYRAEQHKKFIKNMENYDKKYKTR
jgi:hypothetical protein